MALGTLIVTIAAGKVSADLEYFPVLVNLANAPTGFWDMVKTDGGDMRARPMSGSTKYPMDLIAFNKVAKTGYAFVRVPVLAAGNAFRIDVGDPSLTLPTYETPLIGAAKVWKNFGPVFCSLAGDKNKWFRRSANWSRNYYPSIDQNGAFIHASGGFARAGRGADPDINARSFSWIGKRTGGSDNGAILSSNGYETGNADRQTLFMRSNGHLGLWNSVDGWLDGGTWALNENMQAGYVHEGTVRRSIFKNGAVIVTDTGCDLVPTDGNFKYFGAESNDINAPLTAKWQLGYMFRGVLSDDWIAFEYENWFNPSTTLSYSFVDLRSLLDMTIYFAGTSIADFLVADSPALETGAGNKDSYVSEGFSIGSSADGGCYIDFDTAINDFWISAYLIQTSGTGTPASGLALYNKAYSTTNKLFHISADSGSNIPKLYYWNGSSSVNFDSGTSIVSLCRWDIHVVISDSGGVFELYRNGELDADFTSVGGDTKLTTATAIDRIKFNCVGVGTTRWSSIIIADSDTRGMRLVQRLPTGAGNDTAWTGAYTDIDETGYSDSDVLTSASPNDIELFTFADLPTEFNASPIAAVVLSGRMQASNVSPTGIDGVARVNGTNYSEVTERAVPLSFGPAQVIFPVNPETLAEWTATDVNAAEFGVRSKA